MRSAPRNAMTAPSRSSRGRSQTRRSSPEPDRRGGLQHRLLALRQAVDARGKDAMHRRRNLESIDRRAEAIRASFPDEAARLDQRVNDLLDEERVAAGALAHQRRQARQGRISAEEVREQLVDRLGTERDAEAPAGTRAAPSTWRCTRGGSSAPSGWSGPR